MSYGEMLWDYVDIPFLIKLSPAGFSIIYWCILPETVITVVVARLVVRFFLFYLFIYLFIAFFSWSIVAVQYYVSYRCTIYQFTIFKGYTPFIVTIKYWLYSLCCITYPCSLFYTEYFVPLNSLPLYCPSPFPFPFPCW